MTRQKQFRPVTERSMYWCHNCHVPLISENCALCGTKGRQMELGPPGDVRFCSPYERGILHDVLTQRYGIDPLGHRIILLNKIGGEDKTDQVIVDGFVFALFRFDLKTLRWQLDLSMEGAAVLAKDSPARTVELSDIRRHLSGKTVRSDQIMSYSDDIRQGEEVIVKKGHLIGVGTALLDARDFKRGAQTVRIRKIGKAGPGLSSKIPSMDEVIKANEPAIKRLGKDAINTIKGMANQEEFRHRPVYVSFSGGKDSLTVLDLTRSALKRQPEAYFINTGLEYPETVEYVRRFCSDNGIHIIELDAGDAFWQHLPDFGPPAKDYRWCCKVCKLAPATEISEDGNCLTVDGKRRYESFSRARIAPKEENPFVPGQVNIYPIRDWRALEVWLYIYWRGLEYNPLYDRGLERIGCWLCPAALCAEYKLMACLHPDLYDKWNSYLHHWAAGRGLPEEYIDHGFWRWREHPPKMKLLARQLEIPVIPEEAEPEIFQITVVSGISPCRAGGYSIEGRARGVRMNDALQIMKIVGDVRFSKDLGVLLTRTPEGSIKIYTDGTIQINTQEKDSAIRLFNAAARQLTRSVRCTGCGICEKACPRNAITVEDRRIRVTDKCDRCCTCTESCVVARYLEKIE